jgi:RHS repeat-associated protein
MLGYTLGGAKLGKMLFDRYDNLTYHEQYYGDLVIKDGQPTRILHGDGTISINGSSVEYHYHLKDHLGNVRLIITPDGNNQPVVLQANDYYPFGKSYTKNFQSSGGAHQPNKYLYNSKEEQEMPGKWLDYGARFYDPTLGRFHIQDRYSESYYPFSPYSYCAGNPIKNIDINGDFIGTIIGGVVGGAAGAYDAYKNNRNVRAGFTEGAVSGAIAGAIVDAAVAVTIATGGGALVVIGVGAVAGAAGGLLVLLLEMQLVKL